MGDYSPMSDRNYMLNKQLTWSFPFKRLDLPTSPALPKDTKDTKEKEEKEEEEGGKGEKEKKKIMLTCAAQRSQHFRSGIHDL